MSAIRPVTSKGVDRGVVFQDFAQLCPWQTAQDNVEFGLEMKGVAAADHAETARRFLRLVDLERFAGAVGRHAAAGGYARALPYNPSVLLMDEPFVALDALTRDDMQRLLVDVWAQPRKTVLYVTHNVAEAVYLSDRVIMLSPHPGIVKAEVRIALPHPRDPPDTSYCTSCS